MGISINKLGGFQEDLKSSFFWSNNLFGFIVFSFTFEHTCPYPHYSLCGELILLLQRTIRQFSLIKHQNSVNYRFVSILDPALYYLVLVVLALLTFLSTAQKMALFFTKRLVKYARKTAV
jgi:hypothetical protein